MGLKRGSETWKPLVPEERKLPTESASQVIGDSYSDGANPSRAKSRSNTGFTPPAPSRKMQQETRDHSSIHSISNAGNKMHLYMRNRFGNSLFKMANPCIKGITSHMQQEQKKKEEMAAPKVQIGVARCGCSSS
jgi:hypothetical protein